MAAIVIFRLLLKWWPWAVAQERLGGVVALEGKEGQLLGWPMEQCVLPFVDVG